ncbi:hypothetical protein FACS1894105_07780 [Clostridia bacterium]|nr:hypothetical protein FACS1894105_07650 [Clostridia bacterium]GHU36798.1 hypothetical protein FACS1894105_07780 [Clostridia bacterium]
MRLRRFEENIIDFSADNTRGKIGDAATVLELSEIRSADDFAAAYRALTEDSRALESVTTPTTLKLLPYLPIPDPYTAFLREYD